MNVVVLKGNLTRDPEVRQVGSGDRQTSVANFTLAVNRHFKRADGSKDKETTYVECELWDTAAEHLAEYCSKGDPLLINGALKLDTWETDGNKRSKLKVRVNNFDRLYRSPNESQSEDNGTATATSTVQTEATVGADTGVAGDDIPF